MKTPKILLFLIVVSFIIGISASCSNKPFEQAMISPNISVFTGDTFEGDISQNTTFEEGLIEATDVFYATYIGPSLNDMNLIEYSFQVNKKFKGETKADNIYVPSGYYINESDDETSNSPFVKGDEYLLVLLRTRKVYYSHDRYAPYPSSIIPLANLAKSKLNGTEANEYSNFRFDNSATIDRLSTYIEEIVSTEEAKIAPPYFGAPLTESEDLEEIIASSSYICQVRLSELFSTGTNAPTCIYICNVMNPIYGDLKDEEINDGILVTFFADTVKPDDEYILFLNKRSEESPIYSLSSKNSVRTVDEYDEIAGILAAQGKS